MIDWDEDEPVQLPEVGVSAAEDFRLFFQRQWMAFDVACSERPELVEEVKPFQSRLMHEAHVNGVFAEYLALCVEEHIRQDVEGELLAEEQEGELEEDEFERRRIVLHVCGYASEQQRLHERKLRRHAADRLEQTTRDRQMLEVATRLRLVSNRNEAEPRLAPLRQAQVRHPARGQLPRQRRHTRRLSPSRGDPARAADDGEPPQPPRLQAALTLAEEGLRVLPLHWPDAHGRCSCGRVDCRSLGKHPRTAHGVKDASSDPTLIASWWGTWPEANLGLATGFYPERGLHLVALDLDLGPGIDGGTHLEDLLAAHGLSSEALQTRRIRTGSGGEHLLFWSPNPVANRQGDGTGIDLRGEGGYVVAPPSLHASGVHYHYIDDRPCEPLPDQLAALLVPGSQPLRATKRPTHTTAPRPALPADPEDMDAWGRCSAFAHALFAHCGIPLGEKFDPPWRLAPKRSEQPSALVYQDAGGLWLLQNFGEDGELRSLTLPEIYHAHLTGQAKRLPPLDKTLWTKRALVELGFRTLKEVPRPSLPGDLSEFEREVLLGFVYLLEIRGWDDEPAAYSNRFAAAWLGLPNEYRLVGAAIMRLRERGLLKVAEERPTRFGKPMWLYRLGPSGNEPESSAENTETPAGSADKTSEHP